jgi:CheY-like chemotaxis protein
MEGQAKCFYVTRKRAMTVRTKVLVIDDNTGFCNITKLSLERGGRYQVYTATSGEQGISMAKRHRPDIVLLDIKMPRMSGGEVAARLMEDPSTSHIPIIFLTGLVRQDEVEAGCGYLSGHPFIAKPFRTEELIKRIEGILSDNAEF